jgi:predicted  nucleic acid-binding Zn-ribbon protein
MTTPPRLPISKLLHPFILLQELDLEIENLENEEKKWPLQRADLEAKMVEVEGRLQHLETLRKQKILERDRYNLEIQEETQRALTYERHLKEVKTNREYQALMHELGQSKKARQEAEEAMIQVMMELEGIEKEIQRDQEEQEKLKGELAGFLRQEEVALKELRHAKQELLDKRELIVREISPQLLARYQFIRRRHARVVAYAVDSTCSGCQRKLPPQMFILVLKDEEIVTCPACQRFLLPPPQDEEEVASKNGSPKTARVHGHP